jgi:hypothetical protein
MNSFRELVTKLESLNEPSVIVKEDKGHLDHPEDAIFIGGDSYAKAAVNAIVATVQNPNIVTIKWDGYPALIFGRGTNGKFAIMDKHMFNKKDGAGRIAYTPELFQKYDLARGVDRSGLHQILNQVWNGLSKEDQGLGYYWGDLLFSQPLQEKSGLYTFKANPNGITYTVDTSSEVGQLMKGKIAGIAIHQYIKPNAASTDEATSLNGSIGQLKNNSNVAIIPSKMPIQAKLKYSEQQKSKADQLISQYGQAVDQLLVAPAGCKSYLNSNLFTSFINQKVRQGNFNNLLKDFLAFAQGKQLTDAVRGKMFGYIDPATKKKVPGHFEINKQGLIGAFMIWSAIYNLKNPVVNQLDKASKSSPVKGYLQDGTQTQEGYVAHSFKFVDRMGFSRQNLLGR